METDKQDNTPAQGVKLLAGLVRLLDFQETNNNPPTYDTGITPLGRWRVTYSDGMWKVIYGHALIVAQKFTPEDAVIAAQADCTARILSALDLDAIAALVQRAYLEGFNASAQGWNGEYPFADHGILPTTDPYWKIKRDTALARLGVTE